MRPNEDMQLKKKNRKSGTPSKVREQDGQAGKVSVWGWACSVVCHSPVNALSVGHKSHEVPSNTLLSVRHLRFSVLFGRIAGFLRVL